MRVPSASWSPCNRALPKRNASKFETTANEAPKFNALNDNYKATEAAEVIKWSKEFEDSLESTLLANNNGSFGQ
jgi:hypothetical protein